jgi:hypothetical protein
MANTKSSKTKAGKGRQGRQKAGKTPNRSMRLSRWTRWLWVLLLIGPTVGCLWTLWDLVLLSGNQFGFWVPFLCGFISWLILFFSVSNGRWVYVLGHELTHGLWALLSGGRVRSLKIHRGGGEIVVTRSNSLVVLAPYFFPFYSMLWMLLWWVFSLFYEIRPWQFGFYWGLGMTYGFHLVWTGIVIRWRQPDLEREGWIFSWVLIVAIHGLLAVVTLTWLTEPVNLSFALGRVADRSWHFVTGIWRIIHWSWA